MRALTLLLILGAVALFAMLPVKAEEEAASISLIEEFDDAHLEEETMNEEGELNEDMEDEEEEEADSEEEVEEEEEEQSEEAEEEAESEEAEEEEEENEEAEEEEETEQAEEEEEEEGEAESLMELSALPANVEDQVSTKIINSIDVSYSPKDQLASVKAAMSNRHNACIERCARERGLCTTTNPKGCACAAGCMCNKRRINQSCAAHCSRKSPLKFVYAYADDDHWAPHMWHQSIGEVLTSCPLIKECLAGCAHRGVCTPRFCPLHPTGEATCSRCKAQQTKSFRQAIRQHSGKSKARRDQPKIDINACIPGTYEGGKKCDPYFPNNEKVVFGVEPREDKVVVIVN